MLAPLLSNTPVCIKDRAGIRNLTQFEKPCREIRPLCNVFDVKTEEIA
jgi:hypothetical protein